MPCLIRRLIAFVPLFVILLCTACSESGMLGPRYGLQDLALSPDGKIVAVRFYDQDLKRPGFGLYDWAQGKFTPLPAANLERSFSDPSFSPDGRSLAAIFDNQVVLIDRETLKVTSLTSGGQGFKGTPIFLPDGSGVLYVAGSPARLVLINLADRAEKTLLDPAIGFGTISRPYFGGPDRIIFAASGPRDPDLNDQLAQFPDSRPATDLHIYGMKFGDQPELILKNLWVEGKRKSRWFNGEQSLQASQDARRIIFIDYAESAAGPSNNVDQEIFAIDGGALKQMTHLNSALMAAALSYDGRTAAFGCDSSHSLSHQLCILDMDSGKVTVTRLLSDIRMKLN